LRISGGQLKGRKISVKGFLAKKNDSKDLRPTSAKVREAIFNILQINGADFLDLYAGTGAVGIEAISRGAKRVSFTDNNHSCTKKIKEYLLKFGLADLANVYSEKADDFIKRSSLSGIRFDIIFADPPYASDEIMKIVQMIAENDLLSEGGCFLAEHSSKLTLPEHSGALSCLKKYKYGDTMLSLYRRDK